jgi:flagellar hook-basal body complex protein FliE
MTISAITPITAPVAPQAAPAVKGGDFRSLLDSTIANVEATRHAADTQVGQFLAGEGGELHTVALATQRAELAFEMFLQVRNKVVQAYQEVMRMQI